jgi:cardiolipin synthase A/B
MFSTLTTAYWATLHGLVTVVAVLCYVIASHVLQQRRHPTAAIAWILFIFLVPYLALPAFLTFGFRKRARPHSDTSSPAAFDASGSWATQTILALGQPAPATYRDLNIHENGHEALNAFWQTIDGARHSIDLCTFILGSDGLGTAVIDRLCAKARGGLRVRLLLDGLGRLMAGRPKLSRLTEAGVAVTLFVPPLHSPLKGRTNLRNHRKMLIADASHPTARLWCGGRNLASEYFDGKPGKPPWHDLSFDLQGPLVRQASALFAHDWAFANGHDAVAETPGPPEVHGSVPGAQLVASGPDQVDDTVYALLVTATYRARRRIALITPYFVPDVSLLMALCLAARRGVAVDLLLPARSNHLLSDFARGRALRALAQAGGRIWLAPQMLHAKLAVIDNALALAGSTNLDSRSLFLNYELMVAFHEAPGVERFAAWFDRESASARPYATSRPGLLRDLAEGMVLWIGFQL